MNANSIRFAPIISAGLLDAIADREAYQAWYPEYCDYRGCLVKGRHTPT